MRFFLKEVELIGKKWSPKSRMISLNLMTRVCLLSCPAPADWTPDDYYYSSEHSSPDKDPSVTPTSPENPDWYYEDDGGCQSRRRDRGWI